MLTSGSNPIEFGHRDGPTLRHEPFGNLYPPFPRNTATAPFLAGGLGGPKRFSRLVNDRPRKVTMLHRTLMGQSVPSVKDNVSPDYILLSGHNVPMAESDTLTDYQAAFRSRVRELREARGWSQEQLAKLLGIEHETYKKYETRSMMPHHLIAHFSILVGRDIDFIMTGESGTSVVRIGEAPPKLERRRKVAAQKRGAESA